MRRLALSIVPAALLGAAIPALARDAAVSIGPGNSFSPRFVAVEVGDMVTWEHMDSGSPHTVTSQPGQEESFDSSPNAVGGRCAVLGDDCMYESGYNSFSHTFDTPGTFNYYCKIHGEARGEPSRDECAMCGQVRVTQRRTVSPPTEEPTQRPPPPPPTGSPSPSPSASPSPSPSPSGSPISSPTLFPVEDEQASGSGGGGGGGRAALALAAVTGLGWIGWLVYKRMIVGGSTP